MEQASKAKVFRKLHERDGAFIIPNPWDAGSARILQSLGFEALATTSAGHAHVMGVPEGFTSNRDVLEHCYEIASAVDIPVSADLEMGFGDSPEDVAETIALVAPTGVVGGSIEDHTGRLGDPIYDFNLAVERVAAAVEAVRELSFDFVLTARCENFLHERPLLDDTIKRLQAYEAAGADVLYAPGLKDIAMIASVCEALEKPVNVVMGLDGVTLSLAELRDAGVKRVSVGSALSRLAFGGLIRAGREMLEKGTFTFARNAASFAEIENLLE